MGNIRKMTRRLFLLFFTTLMLALPAQARPRDEVMSGAFRCAAIGDARTWLDCYYGAAQPARAALGMTSAPDTQVKLVAAPPAGTVSANDAALRDQVLSGAFRCNDQGDERQWLNCYYAAAQPARIRLGLVVATMPPPPVTSSGFGLPAPRAPEPDGIISRMASYKFDTYGVFTVTLANGQVWQQIPSDDTFARWNKPASSYTARISKGLLGSFNLQVEKNPGLFRVRRVT